MKFYIASRLENANIVSRVAAVLKAAGHVHTYDWTEHGSVQGEGEGRLREVADAEKHGVKEAELVIVILPGGRGTHAELGMALGLGTHVLICTEDEAPFIADDRTCAFYWSTGVRQVVGSMDVWLEAIFEYAYGLPKEGTY